MNFVKNLYHQNKWKGCRNTLERQFGIQKIDSVL